MWWTEATGLPGHEAYLEVMRRTEGAHRFYMKERFKENVASSSGRREQGGVAIDFFTNLCTVYVRG